MLRRGKVVGAGKTIDLVVSTSGIQNGEQAQFEIFKKADNSSLATVSGNVNNGKAKATWKAEGPAADDDEQEWELYYKVKCKGRETKATGFKVYTDWIEVETVDHKDAALKGASYQLQVSSTKRRGDSGDAAKFKEEELPYGKIKIDWQDPFYLVEWVDELGPKRKAKVRKICKPILNWPKPVRGEHRQFVNLDASDDHPEFGSKIKLKVGLEDAVAGDYLYAKTQFSDDQSKRNSPAPGIDGGTCEDWCPDGGKEYQLESTNGEIEVEIELGQAGGDHIDVWLSGSEEFRKDKTIKLRIVNWRKVYYQLTVPKGRTLHPLTIAKTYLERQAYLEYEEYSRVEVDASAAPAGSWIPGAELGKKTDQLNVGSTNKSWFQGKFSDDKSPVGVHIIICDTQYDEGTTQSLEAAFQSVIGKIPIKNGDDYDALSISLKDGTSAFKSGTWTSEAPSGHPDHGKSGDIDASWVTANMKAYPDKVRVCLGGDAALIVGKGKGPPTDERTKHPVKVSIQYEVAKGPYLGEASGKHQLIVLAPNKKAFNGLLVHELGHMLAQTLDKVAPGLSAADHEDHKYTGKGHQGSHCRYGVKKKRWDLASYESLGGRCVMFGEGPSDSAPRSRGFCKYCRPFVRAHDCKQIG